MQCADHNSTPSLGTNGIQKTVDLYNADFERFKMQVNTSMARAMIQLTSGQNSPPMNISINGQPREEFERIQFLSIILSKTPIHEKRCKIEFLYFIRPFDNLPAIGTAWIT